LFGIGGALCLLSGHTTSSLREVLSLANDKCRADRAGIEHGRKKGDDLSEIIRRIINTDSTDWLYSERRLSRSQNAFLNLAGRGFW